jgi:hypothetical protein
MGNLVVQLLPPIVPSQDFGLGHVLSEYPAGTIEHIPRSPGTLHALQFCVHVLSQQYPSMQLPLEHSPASMQGVPLGFLQTPAPLQMPPPPHGVLSGSNGLEGTPAVQTSFVQMLLSTGTSTLSGLLMVLPWPSHSMTLQSFDIWPVGRLVPIAVKLNPHIPPVHVRALQKSSVPAQSVGAMQPTH